jgi:hypothetical protein
MVFMASDADLSGVYSATGRPATIAALIMEGRNLWESLEPELVFMIPVLIDIFVRLPILSTVPETLDRDQNAQVQA